MCIAASGAVLSIEGNYAKVDSMGNICDVNISLVNVSVGEYVLIHAGCAIDVIKKEMHDEISELYAELYEEVKELSGHD